MDEGVKIDFANFTAFLNCTGESFSPHTGRKLNVFSRPMSEETKAMRTEIPDYSEVELKTPEGENV